ncbi:MAG: NAD(P)H-dependent oxidoreductase [Roseitalea sp.]|jgi:NAD(P)H dehydrogenase (quinone)|nr:NAD(P)H-dependent oxidoreductase [Roseitalea sp.]MBO6722045.1 NAD(P)H-dependent oxidoreductase [Roseitalea sp.]MBO6741665.1 NAD(P)H-dependent oxidoreductase [Roseitalea sp.]
MKALIVHAHPEPRSFVAAMRDVAAEALGDSGYEVVVSDLYAEGFDPVAKPEDFLARADPDYLVYAKEQRHCLSADALCADIAREFERLMSADLLVLTFPIFWFSAPAMLKGWIDRVFLSGAIYGGRRFYDRGALAGRRALVGAALGGREHMFGPGSVHGDLTVMLRHLLQGTLGYAGYDVVEPFFAHHVPYVDDAARAAMLEGWRACLENIDARPVLPMPTLDDFDDRMRPVRPAKPALTE